MDDFVKKCTRTEAPIDEKTEERLIGVARLLHAAMGMQTEPGEFTDSLKKYIFYGAPLDITNLKEEAADTLWYVGLMCDVIGCTLEELQEMVINKLQKRYPEKFTDHHALNRDLEGEREVLEGQKIDPAKHAGPQGLYEATPYKQTPPEAILLDGPDSITELEYKSGIPKDFRYSLDENGNLPFWPYCIKCHEPMIFDKDEPFAYCKCGTGEWGNPRPAPYVVDSGKEFFSKQKEDKAKITPIENLRQLFGSEIIETEVKSFREDYKLSICRAPTEEEEEMFLFRWWKKERESRYGK